MLASISGIRRVAHGIKEGVHRLQFPEATRKMAVPVNIPELYINSMTRANRHLDADDDSSLSAKLFN